MLTARRAISIDFKYACSKKIKGIKRENNCFCLLFLEFGFTTRWLYVPYELKDPSFCQNWSLFPLVAYGPLMHVS